MGMPGESFYDDEADGFLLCEMAFHVYDADREEVCFIGEGVPSAVVDVDGTVRCEAMQEPKVAVANGMEVWKKAGV